MVYGIGVTGLDVGFTAVPVSLRFLVSKHDPVVPWMFATIRGVRPVDRAIARELCEHGERQHQGWIRGRRKTPSNRVTDCLQGNIKWPRTRPISPTKGGEQSCAGPSFEYNLASGTTHLGPGSTARRRHWLLGSADTVMGKLDDVGFRTAKAQLLIEATVIHLCPAGILLHIQVGMFDRSGVSVAGGTVAENVRRNVHHLMDLVLATDSFSIFLPALDMCLLKLYA